LSIGEENEKIEVVEIVTQNNKDSDENLLNEEMEVVEESHLS
jgi:hypothetical protein